MLRFIIPAFVLLAIMVPRVAADDVLDSEADLLKMMERVSPILEMQKLRRDVARWRDTVNLACADPDVADGEFAETCRVEPSEQVLRQRVLRRLNESR